MAKQRAAEIRYDQSTNDDRAVSIFNYLTRWKARIRLPIRHN